MQNNILSYFIILVVFLILDILWIGFVAKKFYKKMLGFLMTPNPNWAAAILFYLLYVLGILVFVVNPALSKDSFVTALVSGGLLGLISYATYDLTNLATVKDWPLKITVIDLIWGTLLTAFTSSIAYFLIKLFI